MAATRKTNLESSVALHQFLRDIEDQESWIKYVHLATILLIRNFLIIVAIYITWYLFGIHILLYFL